MESAQDQQDEAISEFLRQGKLKPRGIKALTVEHGRTPSEASSDSYDPIENAMRRHPGLTREQAEKLAEAHGF